MKDLLTLFVVPFTGVFDGTLLRQLSATEPSAVLHGRWGDHTGETERSLLTDISSPLYEEIKSEWLFSLGLTTMQLELPFEPRES